MYFLEWKYFNFIDICSVGLIDISSRYSLAPDKWQVVCFLNFVVQCKLYDHPVKQWQPYAAYRSALIFNSTFEQHLIFIGLTYIHYKLLEYTFKD